MLAMGTLTEGLTLAIIEDAAASSDPIVDSDRMKAAWDAASDFSLSSNVGQFLHSLAPQGPVINGVSASHKDLVVSGQGFDAGSVVIVNGQDQQTTADVLDETIADLVGLKSI
jgi:hypothetical protein